MSNSSLNIDTLTVSCSAFWTRFTLLRLNPTVVDAPANYLDLHIKQAVKVLLCCTLLLSCLLALPRPQKDDHGTRATLQALMMVMVPTCSLWPSRYTKLARVSRSRMSIPLDPIIADFLDGIVEFRNAIDDLANLIGPGATAYGRTVSISIGWKWWIDTFWWWTVTKVFKHSLLNIDSAVLIQHAPWDSISQASLPFTETFSQVRQCYSRLPPAARSPMCRSPFISPTVSSSPDSGPVFCLDYQPPGFIPSLTRGRKLTLEFTAFSPSFRRLTTTQVVSTIPFILSLGSARCPRSPVSVLKQLSTSHGPNLVVDALSNVSVDYESALRRSFDFVSGDQKTRDIVVKTSGLKGWRRGVFLLALEAALVRRGWLERWAVQVTIK